MKGEDKGKRGIKGNGEGGSSLFMSDDDTSCHTMFCTARTASVASSD